MKRLLTALTAVIGCILSACTSGSSRYMAERHGTLLLGLSGSDIPTGTMYAAYQYPSGTKQFCRENRRTGQMDVCLLDSGGTVYMGDRVKTDLAGHGVMIHSNFTYYGHWERSQWNGNGIIRWSDGTIYMGTFENNQATGHGCIWYTNGNVYSGAVLNGDPHGKGVYYWNRQALLASGDFDRGTMIRTNEIAQPPLSPDDASAKSP